MSLNLNKSILAGRITAAPELTVTTSGISVTSFTIAVNRPKSKDGEQQADFINCVAWRSTAEFITKYFKKGAAICISGAIRTRDWTDKDGKKRYTTEVYADEAFFVENKADAPKTTAPSAPSATAAPSAVTTAAEEMFDYVDTDELPV